MVYNKLIFIGDDEEIFKLLGKIAIIKVTDRSLEYLMGTINFERIIGMPADIYRGPLGSKRDKYSERNWYDWRCKNWNTKWNALFNEDLFIQPMTPIKETLPFMTAWNPCYPVIQKLSEMFPEVYINYYFIHECFDYGGILGYLEGDNISTETSDECCDAERQSFLNNIYKEIFDSDIPCENDEEIFKNKKLTH